MFCACFPSDYKALQTKIEALLAQQVPWDAVTVWQVDERIAPDGDKDRNALQLVGLPCDVRLMPVTAADLGAATARYARSLPAKR